MKLGSATREYVAYKQAIGMVFETEAVSPLYPTVPIKAGV